MAALPQLTAGPAGRVFATATSTFRILEVRIVSHGSRSLVFGSRVYANEHDPAVREAESLLTSLQFVWDLPSPLFPDELEISVRGGATPLCETVLKPLR